MAPLAEGKALRYARRTCLVRSRQRERHVESRASRASIADGDPSSIAFDKFFRQGQADAGAVGLGAKKGLKNSFSTINGDPFPGIFNRNVNARGGTVILYNVGSNAYATPFRRGFECIGDQAHKNLLRMIGIQLQLGKVRL